MINPMNIYKAKAAKFLIQPSGDMEESEMYQVYKYGKQLELAELEKEIKYLEEADKSSLEDLKEGRVWWLEKKYNQSYGSRSLS